LQISLAEIRWVEGELGAVGFVYLSQEGKSKLQRLCREPVDPGVPGMRIYGGRDAVGRRVRPADVRRSLDGMCTHARKWCYADPHNRP